MESLSHRPFVFLLISGRKEPFSPPRPPPPLLALQLIQNEEPASQPGRKSAAAAAGQKLQIKTHRPRAGEREREEARRAWQAPVRSSQHATRKRGLPAEANVLISGQTERGGRASASASLTDGRRTIAVIVHGGRADSPRPAGQPRRLSIPAKKASRALREEGRARIRLSVSLSWRPAIPVRRSVCPVQMWTLKSITNGLLPGRAGRSRQREYTYSPSVQVRWEIWPYLERWSVESK